MKIKHFIAALALMCVSTASFAQFKLGAKAGLVASWVQGTVLVNGDRVMPHNNGFGGISAEYLIGDMGLVEADVLFSMKGHLDRNMNTKIKSAYDIGYLEIPIMGGVSLWENRVNLMAGPQIDVMLFGRGRGDISEALGKTRLDEYFKRVTCDIVLQGNYMFLPYMGVEVKLNWGLSPVVDNKKVFPGIENITNGGRNVGVSLGMVFKLGLGNND